MWWQWTSPGTGQVTVTTDGSSFDTVLAVYTGSAVSSLVAVASNDDVGTETRSAVTFGAKAGTTYQIAVDGSGVDTGGVQLNISPSATSVPNDCSARPTTLSGFGRTAFTTVGATIETGEPTPSQSGASVWFAFTPTTSGIWVADTIGTGFDTVLGVYTGSGPAALTSVGSDDDSGGGTASKVQVNLTAGTRYLLRVAGNQSSTGAGVIQVTPAGRYREVSGHRLLDTRSGVGGPAGPWNGTTDRELKVVGSGGVPSDAVAVVLAWTVVGPTSSGFGRLWPAGTAEPAATVSNWGPRESVTNTVVARVGSGGSVRLKAAQSGSTDSVVDVVGYLAAGSGAEHVAVAPARPVDSRSGRGTEARRWSAQESRRVRITDASTPAGATSAAISLSTVDPTGSGFARVAATSAATRPVTVLNWAPGVSQTGYVVTPLAADGTIDIYTGGGGTTHVVVDVLGYFVPDNAGDGDVLIPIAPGRVADSRSAGGAPYGGGECRNIGVVGVAGLPAGAVTPILSLSAVGPTARGYLRLSPDGSRGATVLNYRKGVSITNLGTTAAVDGAARVCAMGESSHVVIDAVGYFVAD